MAGRMGSLFSVGAREGRFITFHPSLINQAPDVQPFFGLGFGNVERKTAAARHCGGAREVVRNRRQALRMRPTFCHRVRLDPHPCPISSYIPVIKTGGRRKNRSARMGKQGVLRRSQEERYVHLGIR